MQNQPLQRALLPKELTPKDVFLRRRDSLLRCGARKAPHFLPWEARNASHSEGCGPSSLAPAVLTQRALSASKKCFALRRIWSFEEGPRRAPPAKGLFEERQVSQRSCLRFEGDRRLSRFVLHMNALFFNKDGTVSSTFP